MFLILNLVGIQAEQAVHAQQQPALSRCCPSLEQQQVQHVCSISHSNHSTLSGISDQMKKLLWVRSSAGAV
jgi:hypothetical protein